MTFKTDWTVTDYFNIADYTRIDANQTAILEYYGQDTDDYWWLPLPSVEDVYSFDHMDKIRHRHNLIVDIMGLDESYKIVNDTGKLQANSTNLEFVDLLAAPLLNKIERLTVLFIGAIANMNYSNTFYSGVNL